MLCFESPLLTPSKKWNIVNSKTTEVETNIISESDNSNTIITGKQPERFQGKIGFVKLGHFIKHFVKNATKKHRREKLLCFFS